MASLRLSFVGDPVVSLNGEAIQLKPRKVLALLAILGITLDRHSRDALVELLFPKLGRDRARAGFRQCLSVLRRSLGGDWISTEGDAVWLDARRGLWVDVQEVRKLERAETREALEQGERFFRGGFLSGFFLKDSVEFELWQRDLEESLRSTHAGILEKLIALYLNAHEHHKATDCARRLLTIDPVHEAGHRALMTCYALSGKRTEALRQYEHCRDLLKDEVGATPDDETEKLRARIASGELGLRGQGARPDPDSVTPTSNLRPSPTTFIGREPELNAVVEALLRPGTRLLTITGAAGTGKNPARSRGGPAE